MKFKIVILGIFLTLQSCASLENCQKFSDVAEVEACSERNQALMMQPQFLNNSAMDAGNAATDAANAASNSSMMMPMMGF